MTNYFIFSKIQLKERSDVEAKLGKQFFPGTVVVRGKTQRFTQLVSDLSKVIYTDYKVVTQTDDLKSVKYTRPYSR